MKTRTIGLPLRLTVLKIYQDIDEMPVDRYNIFNLYSLKDAEIGNTMEDVGRKYTTLATLVITKQNDKANQELNNLFQTHWSIINKLNYKSLAFMSMIHSIDDQEVQDLSEENLILLTSQLSKKGLTMRIVKEEIDSLKKKLLFNWN
jgi:hypothetical protein